MNWKKLIRSLLLFIVCVACVDRLSFDLEGFTTTIPVIVGYISDQPGPYRVTVSKSYDIESDPKSKTPLSVKSLIIFDHAGVSEELTEVSQGVYQTDSLGIRGIVGRAYTLRVELLNGNVYESFTDTLLNSGKLDSIYFEFTNQSNSKYGFDIFFNSTASVKNNYHFLWKFRGTFQAETNPELAVQDAAAGKGGCFPQENGVCNFSPLCSGLRNKGSNRVPRYERVTECECCTCWYSLFNQNILLNDEKIEHVGKFQHERIYSLPLNSWVLSNKVHIKIDQFSLTQQTFRFWKAIRNQQTAVNSLFQPVNGKILSNFKQLSGEAFPMAGIFYAASISGKSDYILRSDVPNEFFIPTNKTTIKVSCLDAFPSGTNMKPPFWED